MSVTVCLSGFVSASGLSVSLCVCARACARACARKCVYNDVLRSDLTGVQ